MTTNNNIEKGDSLIKFPQVNVTLMTDPTFICIGGIPFAKHNLVNKNTGKQIGFLTEHAIIYIIKGKKYFHFDTHTVCTEPNELILVRRGIYTISEFIPEGESFEALILFIPDHLLQTLIPRKLPKNIIPTQTNYLKHTCSKIENQFFKEYLKYFMGNFDGKEPILSLKLQELFILLLHSHERDSIHSWINACIAHEAIDLEYIVKEHLFKPLTVEDYAKLSYRSLAKFKRDFKGRFNMPPRQWINKERMGHGHALLVASSKAISEIAYECGFESPSHFIKLFKSQYGCTPTQFRAKQHIQ